MAGTCGQKSGPLEVTGVWWDGSGVVCPPCRLLPTDGQRQVIDPALYSGQTTPLPPRLVATRRVATGRPTVAPKPKARPERWWGVGWRLWGALWERLVGQEDLVSRGTGLCGQRIAAKAAPTRCVQANVATFRIAPVA